MIKGEQCAGDSQRVVNTWQRGTAWASVDTTAAAWGCAKCVSLVVVVG